jgi:hypothetical protein
VKKPKIKPKPETWWFHCKGKCHWERSFPKVTSR